ncbi:hypothetical protein BJ138DRAFT_562382 [Hygrophoropsis aurantiaca]|uniref:Uncharacterized protein n=1 Tax=Hygrophoropsis aurantiaca TaxID=72124 RepID=A0ACB8AJW3_9AGAM|nr:hypothetical protein BJ138DRAFT_562382 [Hygrophoropsis aurantiaca]
MSIHPRYNRSPSPASQDSFGGGVSQDPQQQFLASSKQFDVPLARLGHDSAEDRAVDLDDTTSAPNDEEVSFLSLARQAYSAQKASEPSIDYAHTDTVLVAATPSHSGGSEGSSQYSRFVESQTRDRFSGHFDHDTDHHSQESTQPFDFDQPTSSLDRLLDKELEESAARQAAYPDLSALDPTQPTDLEPTQPTEELPATQPDDTNPVDDDMVQDPETNSPSWVYPAAPSVVTSSAPRSLISMVHPHQKHRIEQLRQLQKNAILKDPLPSRAVQDVAAETQLSRAEESHLGPTSEPAPIKKPTPPPLRRVDRRHLARNQATSENDALEIIPDSEPLRAVRGTTPVHENPLQRPINGSPTKRPFKPISPMSEHASGELVPDSIEMEEGSGGSDQGDDDDDIPLVSVLANKGLSTNVGHKDKVTTIQTMSSAAEPSKTQASQTTGIINQGHHCKQGTLDI